MEPDTLDPLPDAPSGSPAALPADSGRPDVEDRVVLGVCGLLAERLRLDALWVRLGFVLLSLAGGIGLVIYGATWLMLIVGPQRASKVLTVAGGATLMLLVPMLLVNQSFAFVNGPLAIVLLLVGLTAALWRSDPNRNRVGRDQAAAPVHLPPPTPGSFASPSATTLPGLAPRQTVGIGAETQAQQQNARARREPRPPRQRNERSVLGRAVFGLAVAVGAAGALIDQLNGGRMHPEQWLGAAAAVCGAGLLVGAFVGRARWLIVPALLLATAGFVSGTIARFGTDGVESWVGDEWVSVNRDGVFGSSDRRVGVGSLSVGIEAVPKEPVVLDLSVGVGSIDVFVNDGVSVRIDADVETGDVNIDGEPRRNGSAGPLVVGPQAADVTIRARVGIGEIRLTRYNEPALLNPSVFESDGVVINGEGFVNIAGGTAWIEPWGRMIFGSTGKTPNGDVVFATSMGEFRYTGQQQLVLPTGGIVDLGQIWNELGVWDQLDNEEG